MNFWISALELPLQITNSSEEIWKCAFPVFKVQMFCVISFPFFFFYNKWNACPFLYNDVHNILHYFIHTNCHFFPKNLALQSSRAELHQSVTWKLIKWFYALVKWMHVIRRGILNKAWKKSQFHHKASLIRSVSTRQLHCCL